MFLMKKSLELSKGHDFYHNDEYVSFDNFRKFGMQDISRLQAGFSQSLVFGLGGNKNYDVLQLYKNYLLFLKNVELLGKSFDRRKHSLVESLYFEWKEKDPYMIEKGDSKKKLSLAPVNDFSLNK